MHTKTSSVIFKSGFKGRSGFISHISTPVKAGAYAIQGLFAEFIVKIDGDYNNVVGLPIGRIMRECIF